MSRMKITVVALPSAPARLGSSSWEPPDRGAPGAQLFEDSEYVHTVFARQDTRRITKAAGWFCREAPAGALRGAEVGDELIFARRGVDRELFVWLVKKKKKQG